MRKNRLLFSTGIAAIVATGALCASMSQARETRRVVPVRSAAPVASIGSFTPAAGDPKLAAIISRSGLPNSGFRFTPADAGVDKKRPITVAVRARGTRAVTTAAERAPGEATATGLALTPIAYNLGVSVGWKRFAVSGDLAKVDLAGLPGSQERVDLGVSYSGKRVSGGVRAAASRPIENQPKLISDLPSYSVDVGGAYRVTRNLDVTAGVRYRTDRDRLTRLPDERRDSQAVYIGTAFRF
ncbi:MULTISPECIES: hypothetical protein [unclassified Sphingomonas]|jgi:hypothetical protein|nr:MULTISPECIES: hypothetical protein [unclassified Sphingomonas]